LIFFSVVFLNKLGFLNFSKQKIPSKLKKIISKLNIASNIIYNEDESPISFKKTINID
jgi:hypothetical protein